MRTFWISVLATATLTIAHADERVKNPDTLYINGVEIGRITSLDPSFTTVVASPVAQLLRVPNPGTFLNTPEFNIQTKKGYLVGIVVAAQNFAANVQPTPIEGEIRSLGLLYDGPNCSGNTYLAAPNGNATTNTTAPGGITQWSVREFGFVIGAPDPADPNGSYYVSRGAALRDVLGQSVLLRTATGLQCNTIPAISITAWSVLPNNPAVTAVPRTLGGRVTIGLLKD